MKKYILLLFSISCFAQFNPVQWYEFGGNSQVNTFIGGIGGTINTKELLASKLGVNVGRIKKFQVIGTDVECSVINGNYGGGNWDGNSSITFFDDPAGLIKNMVARGIRNCANLEWVNYPSLQTTLDETFIYCPKLTSINLPELLTSIGSYGSFRINSTLTEIIIPKCTTITMSIENSFCTNNPLLTTLDIRSCTTLGSTQGRDGNIFNNSNLPNLTIYANSSLQTSNGGGVEGDLAFAIAGGATIIWIP